MLATGSTKKDLVCGRPDGFRHFSSSSGPILDSLDEVCVSPGPLENPRAERVLECSTPWFASGEEAKDITVVLGRVDLVSVSSPMSVFSSPMGVHYPSSPPLSVFTEFSSQWTLLA